MNAALYQEYLKCKNQVSIDTRNINPGCMFFALKGEKFDGNKFAAEALQKGARWAIIDNPEYSGDNTILVDDVLKELQELAKTHRKNSRFTVIGLTGTNGKTTTKELINVVLSTKFVCTATKGNLNNHIGVPLTILSADSKTEILIVEMGANHIGEIKFLSEISEPDFGLITNIGKGHLEGFGSINGVIKAKSELYSNIQNRKKTIFFNSNNTLLTGLLHSYTNIFGYGSLADKAFIESFCDTETLCANLVLDGQKYKLDTQLFGKYNADNILAAVSIGYFFGVPGNQIINAVNSYTPANRSRIINTKNNKIIVDCYNANPSSMEEALKNFFEIKSDKKIIILGEMKELGESSRQEHENILTLIQSHNLFKIFLVGKEFNIHLPSDNFKVFENSEVLAEYLKKHPIENCSILLKGSRTNGLERLLGYL